MKQLPTVTLVCIEGRPAADKIAASLAAVKKCLDGCAFRRSLFVCPARPDALPDGVEWVRCDPMTYRQYNQFVLQDLRRLVSGDGHILLIQDDSWIVDPSLWEDGWLEYDYIGAPWPFAFSTNGSAVGNGGFSLRSHRLLERTASLEFPAPSQFGEAEDQVICTINYAALASEGFRFAPPDVAGRFSIEQDTPWSSSAVFGQHARELWLASGNEKAMRNFLELYLLWRKELAVGSRVAIMGGSEWALIWTHSSDSSHQVTVKATELVGDVDLVASARAIADMMRK